MRHDTIRFGDSANFVELSVLELGKLPGMTPGDVRLDISVRDNDFAASYDQVWIAEADWSRFMQSLSTLEKERTGHASLRSMSPDEFELNLRIVGHAGGCVNADGYLSRYHFGFSSGIPMQSRVYYSIAVDPSLLREIVESFLAITDP